ncbi:MAG: hypothetical protein JNJ57_00805 [Saprospiraceae bacterium]|nr:hypothetical protein [Saprospiraceae bacterium]
MQILKLKPPFDVSFDAILPSLYQGVELKIKLSQPYAIEHLKAGLMLTDDSGTPLARIAIYQNPEIELNGQLCIMLGAYECIDNPDVSKQMFNVVFEYLNEQNNLGQVIGPMDGSSWNTYRFVSEENPMSPFLLEPFAKPWYPAQWKAAGFTSLMRYRSNIAGLSPELEVDFLPAQQKFEAKGIVFRAVNQADEDAELLRLARFNLKAFQDAFLYTPISEQAFVDKNRKIWSMLDPEMVQLALFEHEICGLIFSYPDLLNPTGKTAVVKTLARLPGEQFRGLGDVLCARIVHVLLKKGYTSMIHALMRETNASLDNSSRFWGKSYKTYELYILDTPFV